MLNKYAPFFIVIIFIAMGCNSSFPVTFHGVPFEDYIKIKESQDSSHVAEIHPIHKGWQLIAFGESSVTFLERSHLEHYQFTLDLSKEPYTADDFDFSYHYPFQYSGAGISSGFRGSYNFDSTGMIRLSGMDLTIHNVPIRKEEVHFPAEKWYYDALTSATKYSLSLDEEYLTVFCKNDVLIFKMRPHGKYIAAALTIHTNELYF